MEIIADEDKPTFSLSMERNTEESVIDTEAKHDIPCRELDCVMPACVNLKLGKMKNDISKKLMRCGRRGRKPKLGRGSRMNAAAWSETHCTEQLWDDIQRVVQDNTEQTAGCTNQEGMKDVFMEESAMHVLDSPPRQSYQPKPFHTLEREISQCLHEFPNSFTFSETKNDDNQQQRETDPTVSDTCQVTKPHVTNNSNGCEPIEIPNAHGGCHGNNGKELEIETIPFGKLDEVISLEAYDFAQDLHNAPSETVQNHQNIELSRSISCGKVKNTSGGNDKPLSDVQPSNKLFGILSLMLQVFARPLTAELEESYARVLEKAYIEILCGHLNTE